MKGKGGDLGGKTDEELVRDLIHIHNAENWLGMDGDSELSMFNPRKGDLDDSLVAALVPKGKFIIFMLRSVTFIFALSIKIVYWEMTTPIQCLENRHRAKKAVKVLQAQPVKHLPTI